MSHNSENTENTENNELKEKITNFLRRNFPQIQMHGGSSSIVDLDEEEGYVQIQLGGACSGCGISPMTTQAIKRRLSKEIEEIDTVQVITGEDSMNNVNISDPIDDSEDTEDNFPQAPF